MKRAETDAAPTWIIVLIVLVGCRSCSPGTS